jgi:FAD/FMN-containing dehydrogenase
MKRRAFCASAIATMGAAAFPFGRAFAAVTSIAADIDAVTSEGKPVTLPRADVEDFRASLRGQLLLPDSADYDAARKIWNGMFDRRPALIARCAGAADVIQSVKFARSYGLLLAVRGGGHSLSGQSVCDNGLMIDLSQMNSVHIDPVRKLARVEPGCKLGDLDRESLSFGLATTTGTVSHTGAAGLTLGGGFGRLGRVHGVACDRLTTVDVVTSDGKLLEANDTTNPDLFWGVRGGGGNFGVVTSFEYRLFPFDGQVYGGHLVFPFAQARDVLRGFAELYENAPDELWTEIVLTVTPERERVVVLDVCYSGSMQSAEATLAPYRRLGKVLNDGVAPVKYVRLQTKDDERARFGRHYYTRSGVITRLERGLIDTMTEIFAAAQVRQPRIALPSQGGAIKRVARDATAFWHRDVLHSVILQASSDDGASDVEDTEWVRANWPAIETFTSGYYANVNLADVGADRVRGAYGGNYDRLVALKNRYDPTNLFRLNANIRPRA